jgi:hypothetical protein
MAVTLDELQLVAEPIGPSPPAVSAPVVAPAAVSAPVVAPAGPPDSGVATRMLNIGFMAGIVLSVFCLGIAGYYLLSYQHYASTALEALNSPVAVEPRNMMLHMYMSRVLLQSCGLAVGMAFGFLGFSLFLLGVGIQVARISPGAFVMLCSAILVGLCATRNIPAQMGEGAPEGQGGADAADRYGNLIGNEGASGQVNLATIPPDPAPAEQEGAR